MAYRSGDRYQIGLLPHSIEEYVADDDPVRAYDVFVEVLDFHELGWISGTSKVYYLNVLLYQKASSLYFYWRDMEVRELGLGIGDYGAGHHAPGGLIGRSSSHRARGRRR